MYILYILYIYIYIQYIYIQYIYINIKIPPSVFISLSDRDMFRKQNEISDYTTDHLDTRLCNCMSHNQVLDDSIK